MSRVTRRDFGKLATAAGMAAALPRAASEQASVKIVLGDDSVAASKQATWAANELQQALRDRGLAVERQEHAARRAPTGVTIVAGSNAGLQPAQRRSSLTLPTAPESFALVPDAPGTLYACAPDARGLAYALTELADRVRYSAEPLRALRLPVPEVATPANAVRAISRCFQSETEDKPWFHDRAFWDAYLSMLAAQRFNRFALTFGLAYDFTRNVTDSYFHFAYPFLVAVPGYDVRAQGLSEDERQRNLEMLRYASDAAAERGLMFQLGLWTHAYQWTDSPHANYLITGLNNENHAAYCRDALQAVLTACPAIAGVVLRIHGESGVAEGSYDFWKTIFEGAARSGRRVELNLHAKGIDGRMIDDALATGLPVTVSPKYWAEHMGLAYQQASIRELEKPPRESNPNSFFALSSGARQFMRYSYGDLLTCGRRYGVYSRMWPGTQRVLLWADPAATAAYGRSSQFCGEVGADLFEPLSFKGRRGSGVSGGRCSYADKTLAPRYDFEKFLYSYRLWGRHLYSPDADPESWRRYLRARFGAAALAVEDALANASRILPLVTTAHGPSAANNTYWPEMYTNMPIVDTGKRPIYGDTPTPRIFGKVSAFDPELFATVDDCAAELLGGERSGRYTAVHVASWLEDLVVNAERSLKKADAAVRDANSAEFRRVAIDVQLQIGLGKFFAAKFRAGVLYGIFAASGDTSAHERALAIYREARAAWATLAASAQGVYLADVTYGPEKHLRGHWTDRLPAIDDDILEMEKKLNAARSGTQSSAHRVTAAMQLATAKPRAAAFGWRHTPPASFKSGEPLELELQAESPALQLRIHYRHVDQAESYSVASMTARGSNHHFSLPAGYTASPFALQYFFQWNDGEGNAGLLPGFDPNVPQQPYYIVPCAER